MRILFVVNVDWFFISHFLHLARRARQQGWDVAVATHTGVKRRYLVDEGLTVVDLPVRRGGILPTGVYQAVDILAAELRRSPDTIVHGFGLFGIVVGTIAGIKAGSRKRVFSITGRGYSAVSWSPSARLVRLFSGFFCRHIADGPSTRWLAENVSDLRSCRLSSAIADGRTAVVGGAGVNLRAFDVAPLPNRPPFKCALVARMIWSKGVDLAVHAVQIARERGLDVELSLVGPLDPDNPAGLTMEQMRQFESQPGVDWLGRIDDINGFWAGQHLAILPSRGGEGIPKALIEAAACGRPSVTTDVPGCNEFAIATQGWSVPPNDSQALAAALIEIAGISTLSERGRSARSAVAAHYTEEKVWAATELFYCQLRDQGHKFKIDVAGSSEKA